MAYASSIMLVDGVLPACEIWVQPSTGKDCSRAGCAGGFAIGCQHELI